ncbi:obtusifoliol 14-alpha demethylase-like [Miscanthus floridulus]|uniref:obtusifoliol 14-alpha demethylase-like n=1 Tax=Miscanthus floridulus TaxID=154761 RepID=UPI003459278B
MDLTNIAIWVTTVVVIFITAVVTKIIVTGRKATFQPVCNRARPPVVNGASLIKLVHVGLTKGLQAMVHDQYRALGSVFTLRFFRVNITFLVGPEVLDHFFQGLESEISHGNTLDFIVPMIGKEMRFHNDALKLSKLRSYMDPMLHEVEDYFATWGQQGVVDLKHEFEQLLMLISSRCLLGREIRENMFDEVHTLFRELNGGMSLASVLFPYAPTPTNRRRDRARAKLSKLFTEVMRSRKSSNRTEGDVLQNLIDSRYKDGRPTTEAEVTGLAIMLLFLGKHTTSVTSTWTGARLLTNGKWLTAAIEEQKEITRRHGDRIDYNALLQMNVLRRCIKEALRMHPLLPVFLRKVHKSFTLRTKDGAEYEIPGGHTLVSPALFNNYLPYIYKDPGVYDLDRFSLNREEDKVGGKFSFTGFGGGRHSCVGEAFGYMQIKVIWSYLLRNFELNLESPFPETDWNKLVASPKGKVMVAYRRVAAA